MTPEQQERHLARLNDREIEELLCDWRGWGRAEQQMPPGDWETWLILAGRGWGKTRTGAEATREMVETEQASRIALIGRTAADVRDVMIEGESGLLAVSRPSFMPIYEPSKRRVVWPNGTIATTYSAEEPDSLRGPQHDFFWSDEVAAWKKAQATWDNLQFGLRLGKHPRGVVTTTPRPIKLIVNLAKHLGARITRGRTRDNAANLAPSFMREIEDKYAGTRLGQQELDGLILDDNPGALWRRDLLDDYREPPGTVHNKDGSVTYDLLKVVVAIDPAVTSNEDSDETGIIVAGKGRDGRFYVLDDVSGVYTPTESAKRALAMYDKWKADVVVAEVNNGGDYIEALLRAIRPKVSYEKVHASRGKAIRAQPSSGLYEQGRVSHIKPFLELEDQLCTWSPDDGAASPDRLDALVWALTWLAEKRGGKLVTF